MNTSAESLIQKLAESKGTGKERPGMSPGSSLCVLIVLKAFHDWPCGEV